MSWARREPARSPREARRLATRVMREWARETTIRYWEKEREWEGSGAVASRRKKMKMREIVDDGVVLAIFLIWD